MQAIAIATVAAALLLVAYDHGKGGNVLPSRFYCWMGAGTSWDRVTHLPIRTGGGFRKDTICMHRSLWAGWSGSFR